MSDAEPDTHDTEDDPRFMRPWWPLRLLLGLVCLVAAYGCWYEPATLKTAEYALPVDAFGAPLRIAVIADLHAGAPYIDAEKVRRVVADANAAQPDLILLAGDYVTQGVFGGSSMPIEDTAKELAQLRARFGVFAVLGNHDRWLGVARVTKALESAGIVVLDDRAVRVGLGGPSFFVVGISDYNSGPHFVHGAMLGVPRGQSALCLTHSPDVFPQLPKSCVLTIAGHTHGGQVSLPFVGRPLTGSAYGERYAAGFVREDGKALFVSTGIGTSIFPVRMGVEPEVSVLDIR